MTAYFFVLWSKLTKKQKTKNGMKRTQVLSFNSRTILDFSRFETVHFWIEIENNI
jgi:hypothetical protein